VGILHSLLWQESIKAIFAWQLLEKTITLCVYIFTMFIMHHNIHYLMLLSVIFKTSSIMCSNLILIVAWQRKWKAKVVKWVDIKEFHFVPFHIISVDQSAFIIGSNIMRILITASVYQQLCSKLWLTAIRNNVSCPGLLAIPIKVFEAPSMFPPVKHTQCHLCTRYITHYYTTLCNIITCASHFMEASIHVPTHFNTIVMFLPTIIGEPVFWKCLQSSGRCLGISVPLATWISLHSTYNEIKYTADNTINHIHCSDHNTIVTFLLTDMK